MLRVIKNSTFIVISIHLSALMDDWPRRHDTYPYGYPTTE